MKKAFTLIELLIVVAIIGIMAAIVMPLMGSSVQHAKESAAKDNLRILRQTIARYAAKNNDVPPGFYLNDLSKLPTNDTVYVQLVLVEKYLKEIPENPFNNLNTMKVLDDTPLTSDQVTGAYGWVYRPIEKNIKLDMTGIDSESKSYFDY